VGDGWWAGVRCLCRLVGLSFSLSLSLPFLRRLGTVLATRTLNVKKSTSCFTHSHLIHSILHHLHVSAPLVSPSQTRFFFLPALSAFSPLCTPPSSQYAFVSRSRCGSIPLRRVLDSRHCLPRRVLLLTPISFPSCWVPYTTKW